MRLGRRLAVGVVEESERRAGPQVMPGQDGQDGERPSARGEAGAEAGAVARDDGRPRRAETEKLAGGAVGR